VSRSSGDHAVVVPRPSRWAYDTFKDDLHFYIMITGYIYFMGFMQDENSKLYLYLKFSPLHFDGI
jgi:hypothetical protein